MILSLLLLSSAMGKTEIEFEDENLLFKRKLEGQGLKKELVTTIQFKHEVSEAIVIENISKDWFIDQEEIPKSLNPQYSSKVIDIEKPSSLSSSHSFNFTLKFPDNKSKFSFPIHLRYNDVSDQDYYRDVSLPGPSIVFKGKDGISVKVQVKGEIKTQVPVGYKGDSGIVIYATISLVLFSLGLIIYAINRPKTNIKIN